MPLQETQVVVLSSGLVVGLNPDEQVSAPVGILQVSQVIPSEQL